jgi:hypothetical protein
MADSKISQLTAIAAVDVASADVFAIVDTSATTTKKISAADLAEYIANSDVISGVISALGGSDPDDASAVVCNAVFS